METVHSMYRKFRKNEINSEWYEFIKDKPRELVMKVINNSIKAEQRLRNYKNSFRFKTKVRKYCNLYLYSDIEPYEVLRQVSPKCVEIRKMRYEQTVFPTQFHVGGFSAHCVDSYSQEYEYFSDESSTPIKIRLSKNGWGKGRYRMEDKPVRYYDYNF